MRLLYVLLYSVFVFSTSLFGANFIPISLAANQVAIIGTSVRIPDSCIDAGGATADLSVLYRPFNGSGYVVATNPHVSTAYCTTRYDWVSATVLYGSCPTGTISNANNICVTPPPPTCTDTQYLDSNNTCQDIPIPPYFPQDANSSHGTYGNGYAPIPQSACDSTSSPDYSTSLGAYSIISWDYAAQKCIASAFQCDSGFIYDSTTKICKKPPDTKNLPTTNDPTDSANSCNGNRWGLTQNYDFCNMCNASLYIWLPPVGLENYGLECNNKYVEYQCITDYRLKKFTQVSCGDVLQKDKTSNELNASALNPTPTKDTNVSNLSIKDSTTAITNKIAQEIQQQKNLNAKVSTASKQDSMLKQLNKMGTKLDQINEGQLSQNGVKNGVKDALDNRDNNLSVPSDINGTDTPGGNGIAAVKNSITSQYTKRYDLFGVTTCGSLSVTNTTIDFMSTTIKNPLVIMDNSLKGYYPMFKALFLVVATFLGLVSVFRR